MAMGNLDCIVQGKRAGWQPGGLDEENAKGLVGYRGHEIACFGVTFSTELDEPRPGRAYSLIVRVAMRAVNEHLVLQARRIREPANKGLVASGHQSAEDLRQASRATADDEGGFVVSYVRDPPADRGLQ